MFKSSEGVLQNMALYFKHIIKIQGVIIESITNEPLPNAIIILDSLCGTRSDMDGAFKLNPSTDSLIEITVTAVGYKKQLIYIKSYADPRIIKLTPLPFYAGNTFVIRGEPFETTYFENGEIEKMFYTDGNVLTYYEMGQEKSQEVRGSYRTYFENGGFKSQSILRYTNHRAETEWYKNRQIKSWGTTTWQLNEQTNTGSWIKNNDWKYWSPRGKVKNYR